MRHDKCPLCVAEFLKGASECSRCGGELSSPVGHPRDARVRSAEDLFRQNPGELQRSTSEDDELENVLFDWKNPVAINIVGSLVCTLILIATLLEL